jgi:predicted N-formylglutamate amidohydrolase
MTDEAVEVIAGSPRAPIVISCEHASERLPERWSWPEADRRLIGTHWAYDLGAAEIARELAAALDAPAVLSRFTRLLVDPNRPLDSDTLFRGQADAEPIALNAAPLELADRRRRIDLYYLPYHHALDSAVAASRADILFAVHTFTPVYEGQPRTLQIGVLFDDEEALAQRLLHAIADDDWHVDLNEPWSGKQGLIYSADRHAKKHGRRPIEIEVRQDLAVDPLERARIVACLARFFGG